MLQESREEMYRFYITDALKIIGGLNISLADKVRAERSHMTAEKAEKEATEIKNRIVAGLGKLGG